MKTACALGLAATIVAVAPVEARSMGPRDYVAAAGASDLYEITSSEIVLRSTRDRQVRSFAQMMIRHHNKSTADVKAAAARAGLRPRPPVLTRAQSDMVAELRREDGEGRDRAYIRQQRVAHDQALALHQSYAREGTSAPLRRAAGKIVPVVRSHIAMLRRM